MSYYTNRRYNPPADVYAASTLVGLHAGSRAQNAVDRELANRISRQLGDSIGNREALILSDPEVTVRRDGAYPGCWKCTSRTAGQMVYRQADNQIVG